MISTQDPVQLEIIVTKMGHNKGCGGEKNTLFSSNDS